MMGPSRLLRHAVDPALSLLPETMRSDEARAMLLAIALQESEGKYRRQHLGPARSYWQFECAGVHGVLTHKSSAKAAGGVLLQMDYNPELDAEQVMDVIEHNDIVAAGFARLLLYTIPKPLPERGNVGEGWTQYLDAWRPGKPRQEKWSGNWEYAWSFVEPLGESERIA